MSDRQTLVAEPKLTAVSEPSATDESLVDYLSAAWLARFDQLVREHSNTTPDSTTTATPLTIGFVVEADDSGPGAHYGVRIEDGQLSMLVADGEQATRAGAEVSMISTRTVAARIAQGERSALDAFMAGDLRLDGETTRLLDAREVLVELADLTAELRSATRF